MSARLAMLRAKWAVSPGPVTLASTNPNPTPVGLTSSHARVGEVDLHWAEVAAGPSRSLARALRFSSHVVPGRACARARAPGAHGSISPVTGSRRAPTRATRWSGTRTSSAPGSSKLGLDEVDLVGHSYGGGVAQWMLLDHRKRVRRLGLEAAGGLGREVGAALRWASFPFFVERFGQPFMSFGTTRALNAAGGAFSDGRDRDPRAVQRPPGHRARLLAQRPRRHQRVGTAPALPRPRQGRALVAAHRDSSGATTTRSIPVAHGVEAASLLRRSHADAFPGGGPLPAPAGARALRAGPRGLSGRAASCRRPAARAARLPGPPRREPHRPALGGGFEGVTRRRIPCDLAAIALRAISAHASRSGDPRCEGRAWLGVGAPRHPGVSSALDRRARIGSRRLDAGRGRGMADDVAHGVAAHRRAAPGGRRRRSVPPGAAGRRARGHRRSPATRHRGADLALRLRRRDGVPRGARRAQSAASHRLCLRDGDRLGARRAALAGDHRGGGAAERAARRRSRSGACP